MRRAEELAASADPAVRGRGELLQQALGRVGNPKLFEEMTDRHLQGTDSVSLEAAEVLKRAGARAVDYLVDRLASEEERGNRAQIVGLLKEMESTSSQAFTARLEDPRWFLVRNVVNIIGEMGDTSAMPALKEIRRHKDPRVRKELVRAFARLGGPECEEFLIEYTTDPDRSVQLSAVNAFGIVRGRRIAGPVLEILRRTGSYANVEPEVRLEAVHVAGRLALKAAVEPLAEMVSRKGLLGYAEPTEMRIAAVQALGAIEGDEALEALQTAAHTDGKREVRQAAEGILAANKP
jgi:HEAT repeat protein